MTYKGRIENGVVVLDEKADLPEGAQVRIEIEQAAEEFEISESVKRFTGLLPEDIDYKKSYYEGITKKHQ